MSRGPIRIPGANCQTTNKLSLNGSLPGVLNDSFAGDDFVVTDA